MRIYFKNDLTALVSIANLISYIHSKSGKKEIRVHAVLYFLSLLLFMQQIVLLRSNWNFTICMWFLNFIFALGLSFESFWKVIIIFCRFHTWSISYVRDFIMACLMVMGGGHRSDVIKNMTLEEWNDRRTETGGDGSKVPYI